MGNFKLFIGNFMQRAGIGLILVLLVLVFTFAAPHFATVTNLRNVFTQITLNTILAVGMTFAILIGGIDLSVGSVMALCTVAAGSMLVNENMPLWLVIILTVLSSMGIGTLAGFFNGFVSTFWGLPSFIVTLGMLNIARGLALLWTDARTIYNFPEPFVNFGSGTIFEVIPYIFIVALAIVALGAFILRQTVFGRMLLAIGNNEEAVRLSGKNTAIIKVLAFTITGWCVGVAGIIYMARLTISSPILGVGFELNAIAAVIIGGTSLFGGKGSFIGTFIGACIIGVLNNGLILMGVGDFARQVVTGAVIIIAVIIDAYRAKVAVQAPA